MKLNLKFVSKIPKSNQETEIIFLNQKNIKNNQLKPLEKSVFSSKLFTEQNFVKKDYKLKSYIFVNCLNIKISLDFEKLGSKLYEFLKTNKVENSIIINNYNSLKSVQLEKILHGLQLKSYNFDLYKTDKKKNLIILI